MIRFLCSLTMLAWLALPAVADVPPPPPEAGFKRVPYENNVILETELPEYRFYTFQQLGLNGNESVEDEIKLSTSTKITVPSTSSPSVRTGIVAAPASAMEELQTKENLAKLLSRDNQDQLPKGVVVYETRGETRDLKAGDPRTKVENIITVSSDPRAGLKFTAVETPPPPSSETSTKPSAILIAGVAMAMAIAALGLKLVGRS